MKQPTKLVFLLLLTALIVSCEKDIIVKDITGKTVTVLAPADNTTTPLNGITFWWEEVDGAEKYDVQIVSPNFNTIVQLISDTSVTGDKFTRSLQPGSYQWRIRATNNGGSTPWVTRNLTIDSTSNLALITVALNSPADSLYTSLLTQTLSWYSVGAADDYNLKVNNINTPTTYVHDADQTTTSASITFPSGDATYTWKVRAQNNYSISSYSSRTIIIDQTAPSSPILLLPANTHPPTTPNSATLGTDSLKWFRNTGSYYDSLYVSTDSLFTGTFIRKKITGAAAYQVSQLNGFPSTTGTIYYWKVKSIDRAGNQSAFATFFRFKTN